MFFKRIKTVYMKNKIILIVCVFIAVHALTHDLELIILNNVALIPKINEEYLEHDPRNDSCSYLPSASENLLIPKDTSFYWTEGQLKTVYVIRSYTSALGCLFGGIYSNSFGAHHVVLVAFVISASIQSTLYLVSTNSNIIFLIMVAIRKIVWGILWGAFLTLTGRLAIHEQQTISIGFILIAYKFGEFMAYLVYIRNLAWKVISLYSGFLGFTTSILWWIVYKSTKLNKVHTYFRIPWKKIMSSFSLYSLCLFNTSCYLIWFIFYEFHFYAEYVVHYKTVPNWTFQVIVLYLMHGVILLFCGIASDYVISKRLMPTTYIRRIFAVLSLVILFCTIVVVKLVKCDSTWVLGACSVALGYSISHCVVYWTGFCSRFCTFVFRSSRRFCIYDFIYSAYTFCKKLGHFGFRWFQG